MHSVLCYRQMKNNTNLQHSEIKDIVAEGCSIPACVATAGTSLIIGFVPTLTCKQHALPAPAP